MSNGVSEMLAASPPAVCQQDLFLGLGSVAEHGDVKVAKGEKTEEEEEEDGEEEERKVAEAAGIASTGSTSRFIAAEPAIQPGVQSTRLRSRAAATAASKNRRNRAQGPRGNPVKAFFLRHWITISDLICAAALICLALRAYYLTTNALNINLAVDFAPEDFPALYSVAFWFAFAFFLLMILDGALNSLGVPLETPGTPTVLARRFAGVADLLIVTPSFAMLVYGEATLDSAEPFGERYGADPNAAAFVPALLFLRFWRGEIGDVVGRAVGGLLPRAQSAEERREREWRRSKAAQNAFNEERRVARVEVPSLILQQHRVGTIVELWAEALKTHGSVVEEHGAFSGELLRKMLEVVEEGEGGREGGGEEGGEEGDEGELGEENVQGDVLEEEEAEGAAGGEDSDEDEKRTEEWITSVTLPLHSSETATVYRTAARKMPPLLPDFQDVSESTGRGERVNFGRGEGSHHLFCLLVRLLTRSQPRSSGSGPRRRRRLLLRSGP